MKTKRIGVAVCAVAAILSLVTGCGKKGSSTGSTSAKPAASATTSAKSSASASAKAGASTSAKAGAPASGSAGKHEASGTAKPGSVEPGAFCSTDGAKGTAASGQQYVCKKASDGRDHWSKP